MKLLNNKAALVTGGARGIGAAIAKRLSADGAAVAITYAVSSGSAEALVKEIEAGGGKALAIQADSGDVAAVKAAIALTVKTFGRLDILVNNAAVQRAGALVDYSLDDLDQMIAVNIKGLFVATQEAARHMSDGGRIINIGSVSSDYMPIPGHAAYAMTKGAVTSLTRGLARELGARGITINNVQPGRIDTDLFRSILRRETEKSGPGKSETEETPADKLRNMIALQRFGTSEEVAGLVSYLTSPEAGFVTGTSLKVDGGVSA